MHWPSCTGRCALVELTFHSKRTITWSTEVRIEKFKILTSISLMWLQFTRRTYCQIPFISYPKTSYKVQLMHMTKNRKIFLVQITTIPFTKHIYRSLRAILNSTLTRNEFRNFQTQPIHKIEGSKPCIYTFYTSIHTIIHTKTLDFHTQIPYTIRSIHTCDLLFPFLLSSFLFSSSSSSSFLCSSLLSVFALSFSKTKMRYLFWSSPYLILSLFYFTFSLFWSILDHPVKGGNFLPLSIKPLVSSTIFFLISF